MPANRTTAFLLVILCLFGAGCVHLSTPAERNASFSPYYDAKVGEEDLWKYLISRAGILLGAEGLQTTPRGTNSIWFAPTKAFAYGTAASIDQRGYFLTAAHCVEKGRVWLGFLRDDELQVERARIVWRGDEKKGEPDLAILCVSHPIGWTFQWAAEFTNGSPVVDVGLRIDDHPRYLQPQCMAGRVSKVSEALSKDSLDYSVVAHNSLLRPGDSGGPLVLSDGRLLGINVSVTCGFQWSHLSGKLEYSTAHRPDLAWLRKVIDADARLFPREISSP
jgi:hypothetical protein